MISIIKCSNCVSGERFPCFAVSIGDDYFHVKPNCFHDEALVPQWNEASTSKLDEALGMQSGPADRPVSDTPLALNAFAPDCLSGIVTALRSYAEQSQPDTEITMTFPNRELSIKVSKR